MMFENKTSMHIGRNEIGEKAFVCELARSMHIQVIGSTGTGKTESFLLPLAFKEMELGKAVIFIDPKGDSKTFQTFIKFAELSGRISHLVVLNLAKPKISQTYNPLSLGTPTELKDKVVGSIIWTEEYYKKIAEKVLLDIFIFFRKAHAPITLTALDFLLNKPQDFILPASSISDDIQSELDQVRANLKSLGKEISGLQSDISLWAKSEFSSIISDDQGPSVLDWIENKKVVYVNLNTLGFEETSRRFGRLLIQDLKTSVQRLQDIDEHLRPKTCVILDEFASIASSGFIELINKARSANVALTLAHQSLGDLSAISESFQDQIMGNTPNKVIFRVDSPDAAEELARMIGTRKAVKKTNVVQNSGLTGDSKTGMGSVRETEEFMVSPNLIKTLARGQAILSTKIPYKVSKIKLTSASSQISNHGRSLWKKMLSDLVY